MLLWGVVLNFGSCFLFRKCFLELIKENYVESNTEYIYVYKTSETTKKRFEDGGNKVFWVVSMCFNKWS